MSLACLPEKVLYGMRCGDDMAANDNWASLLNLTSVRPDNVCTLKKHFASRYRVPVCHFFDPKLILDYEKMCNSLGFFFAQVCVCVCLCMRVLLHYL